MRGFLRVQWKRSARPGIAELAATGADVTAYHEGGGSFPPALSHVGATATAANGVQAVGVNDTFGFGVPFVGSYTYFKPFGFTYSVFHNSVIYIHHRLHRLTLIEEFEREIK